MSAATIDLTDTDPRLVRTEVLLVRSGIDLAAGVDHDQVVAMLARLLDRHDPATDDHGRLLIASLRGRSKAERRGGRRPLPERAVRALIRVGSNPTPAAVAGQLEQYADHDRALAARAARLRPQVDRDGPAAAMVVIDHWRRWGRAPSPTVLGHRMRWDPRGSWILCHLMVESGWLANEGRRLVPGSKARGPEPLGDVSA